MILWLTSKSGYSPAIRAVLTSTLARAGVSQSTVIFNSLHFKCKLLSEHDKNKMPDKFALRQAEQFLTEDVEGLKPNLIVINDEDTLRVITGKKYSLQTVRGSLYYYRGVPCLVIDKFATINYQKQGKFVFELDLAKIARWACGKQKNEPVFTYCLCSTVEEVSHHCRAAAASDFITEDTETAGGFITVISFTYNTPDGKLVTFVVPFFDPWCEGGAYWKTESEEIAVRKLLKELNASKVIKGFANGTYDCAYEIAEDMVPVNYFVDTQNLMHSIWCEAPKKLNFVTSLFVDHYTYWKDENKGVKEDGFGKDHSALDRYWRYNGLDSYYTWLSAFELLDRIVHLSWAMFNYNSEFRLSVGPCLAASLRGIRTSRARHAKIMLEQSQHAEDG